MSKFLTPPVWYDKNGNLNQMLIGDARNTTSNLQSNISIGESSLAGAVDGVGGSLSIGYGAKAKSDQTIVVGAFSDASDGGIAIGHGISVVGGGIGIGGSATANQIQLGDPSSRYDLKIGDGISGTVNGVDFSSVFKTIGAVKMASKAFTIYNKTSEGNESNVVNFSGLEHTGKYLIAIRYAFKDQTTGGLTREPEGSAFIIINQNYQKDTVTYGGLSAGYTNGQMAFMFPKYIKTDDATGTLQMQRCDSAGNIISNNNNIDIIMAYAILLDT